MTYESIDLKFFLSNHFFSNVRLFHLGKRKRREAVEKDDKINKNEDDEDTNTSKEKDDNKPKTNEDEEGDNKPTTNEDEKGDNKPTIKIKTDHLLPKNLQKMKLLLNPDMEHERDKRKKQAKEKFHDQFGEMDMKKSYRNLFPILWYSQLPCFDVKNITSNTPGEMSIIKKCFWKEMEMPCPSIFTAMPTDRGMCCIFNMKKAEDIFQKSEYASLIQTLQNMDRENR